MLKHVKDVEDYIALQPLGVFDLSLTSSLAWTALHPLCVLLRHCFDLLYSIQCIQCYVSQHLQHQTMCIDTYWHVPFNVHTTDKVTMGVNEWLPHYLI